MRSALICVFLTLLVQRHGNCTEHVENFKPTPIPLSEWPRDYHEAAGTLQEIIKTDSSPSVAAIPAHYWEDALRHSVYLTLVRDKIDQLIAKGDYISPDTRPEQHQTKEIDDHDLWDKIKTARFDRVKEEPLPPADVTILAKGRLYEDREGYRFVEDDASRGNCSDSNCMKGIKAFWSVKRMRQGEASPGKYHYELTFSVSSQANKKVKKPYENPVRTFTIKENSPTERPQQRANEKPINHHGERPQRAIWVHKNINPSQQKRLSHSRSLDRIFSSLFSDEDSYEEPTHRFKPKIYLPNVYPQHPKVGFADEREPYRQKKVMPYPLTKPQPYRYPHGAVAPPPVQYPYLNIESLGNHQYLQQFTDNRYLSSNLIKTTKAAVLPTPITNHPLLKESTMEVSVKTKLNATEYTTKLPDVVTTHKIYNHPKHSPMKISYLTDHVRPPVYNAPPGVFVTMDKKPFKPMPPLKYNHSHKPQKATLLDFRPSPQVLDSQFSELDSTADAAFRPIAMNYTEISDVKNQDNSKKNIKTNRKTNITKKPAKKHENIKSIRLTTTAPEIITAQNVIADSSMEWANVVAAFAKTTPMGSSRDGPTKEDSDTITSTTPLSTVTSEDSSEIFEDYSESESTSASTTTSTTTTTTTTPKPKKRTRPPPKFNKVDKLKKHKRVTTTTTTTTTTAKPTRKYHVKKVTDDLTPQASSAATGSTNSVWETKTHKAPTSTTTSSTTPRPTTTVKLITMSTSSTTSTASTTVDTEQPVATTQPKSKNRFRQSTLMHKGTSVNHDKWSFSALEKNRTNSTLSHTFSLRRKASKFQGYIPASTPRNPEVERDKEDHRDRVQSLNEVTTSSSSTTEQTEEDILAKMPPTYEDQNDDTPSKWHDDELDEGDDESVNESEQSREPSIEVQESKDNNEYIFPTQQEKIIENYEDQPTTELTVVASPYSISKNKTKCKKKKHNNLTFAEIPEKVTITSTTVSPVTPDIFNELFGGFTMDDSTEELLAELSTTSPELNQSESEKHERYIPLDDDLEDFLHSLDQKPHADKIRNNDDKIDEEYDDDANSEEDDSPFNNDEENFYTRNLSEDDYQETEETRNRPISLLELMAME